MSHTRRSRSGWGPGNQQHGAAGQGPRKGLRGTEYLDAAARSSVTFAAAGPGRETVWSETPAGRRCIGEVVTVNGIASFRKTVQGSKHLLRLGGGAWGFQADLLPALERKGVRSVILYDTETGDRYVASLQTIAERGFTRDLGHGRQVFVARRHFHREAAEQLSLLGLGEEVAA